MGYLSTGDVDSSSYTTSKTPGVAQPKDTATLQIFKTLQAQANRVAQGLSLTKVSVDGSLGPKTVNLLAQIKGVLGQGGNSVDPARNILILADTSSAGAVAAVADTLGNACKAVADQMGVSSSVSQPTAPSSIVLPSGAVASVSTPTPASANLLDAFGGMDTTTLALAAGAIGLAIYVSGGKKGKRGRARR